MAAHREYTSAESIHRHLIPTEHCSCCSLILVKLSISKIDSFVSNMYISRLLNQNPDMNINLFFFVNRGRITGIALDNHAIVLHYRHKDVPYPLEIDACMRKIREGAKHIHSLGFARNDLNPTNILLGSNENLVMIDFSSCKRVGEELISGGTYGWIDEDYSTSAQSHDESALDKIDKWLRSITLRDA